jgi:hypothetical protein
MFTAKYTDIRSAFCMKLHESPSVDQPHGAQPCSPFRPCFWYRRLYL